MGPRSIHRRRALQLLYSLEFNRLPYEEAERLFLSGSARTRKGWGDLAHRVATLAHEQRKELDAEIAKALRKWKLERIALTDRLCLRMALAEFQNLPDIPLRVTIDEYVELARVFGGEKSPAFVNGVLDQISKQFPHKDFHQTVPRAKAPPRMRGSAPAAAAAEERP